jgi:hypothetical protein
MNKIFILLFFFLPNKKSDISIYLRHKFKQTANAFIANLHKAFTTQKTPTFIFLIFWAETVSKPQDYFQNTKMYSENMHF